MKTGTGIAIAAIFYSLVFPVIANPIMYKENTLSTVLVETGLLMLALVVYDWKRR